MILKLWQMVHFQHYISNVMISLGLMKVDFSKSKFDSPQFPKLAERFWIPIWNWTRDRSPSTLWCLPRLCCSTLLCKFDFTSHRKFLEILLYYICNVLILKTTFWQKMSLYIYKFSSFYRLVYWWIVIKSSCIFGRFDVNKHPFCEERCESRWLLWRWVWQSGQGGHLPYWTLYGAWFEPDFILSRRP